jgi:hypothetical protein
MTCSCKSRRHWRVTQYRCNHSAFNGYHYTPSDYSSLRCLRCGATWRTKARYVSAMPTATRAEAIQANNPSLPA